jgi:hypothetical protein
MLVAVHQPNFLPWLKLLDKILAADVYVAYDTVQLTHSEFHARQRVLGPSGPVWLSVPVRSVGARQPICAASIDNRQPWIRRHLKTLRAYHRAPCFAETYGLIEAVHARGHELLVDLNVDLIEALCRYLGSPVRIVRASALAHSGDNTQRLIDLVHAVAGTAHLTSTYGTARRYIDWDAVRSAGIEVRAQVFEHPRYAQPWPGFVAGLSAIDLLFSRGRDALGLLTRQSTVVGVPCGG